MCNLPNCGKILDDVQSLYSTDEMLPLDNKDTAFDVGIHTDDRRYRKGHTS